MARVRVRLYATVREAAGASECQIDARDIQDLLVRLRHRFGRRFAATIEQAESDPERLVVLVNGKTCGAGDRARCVLTEGDEIAIFPPVSGG